jgi:hypothetical protein
MITALRKTAVAVAAGAGLMLVAAQAQAVVVTVNTPLAIPLTLNGLYLNVVTGAINEPGNTAGTSVPGWDINPYGTAGLSFFASTANGATYVSSAGVISNLTVGSVVSAASTYLGGASTPPAAGWNLNSTNNYVGFRFLNEGTGLTNYGYFQLSIGASTTTRSIVSYAYENTGLALTVGAVPEPATYGLMGLGMAGVLLAARRRQQA